MICIIVIRLNHSIKSKLRTGVRSFSLYLHRIWRFSIEPLLFPKMKLLAPHLSLMLIVGSLALGACGTVMENPVPSPHEVSTYLVLGHIYQWGSPHDNNRVDHRLEGVDFSRYAGILLGGDICTETTKYESTVEYLDNLFDLQSEGTMWSLGNHDARNGNSHWITERTERPLFYTAFSNNVQWLILNSPFDVDPDNPDPCVDMAEQWDLITTVLDTVAHADNLVILMHYAIWGNVEREGMRTAQFANAEKSWVNLVCDSIKRFETHVYPLLLDVAERGIRISVISGDGGQKSKRYSYRTAEGIDFFITGINNSIDTLEYPAGTKFNFNPDSVLELKIDDATGILESEFIPLSKIIE